MPVRRAGSGPGHLGRGIVVRDVVRPAAGLLHLAGVCPVAGKVFRLSGVPLQVVKFLIGRLAQFIAQVADVLGPLRHDAPPGVGPAATPPGAPSRPAARDSPFWIHVVIPQRVPTVGDKQGPRVLQQERRLMGEMMRLMEENDAPPGAIRPPGAGSGRSRPGAVTSL